MSQITLKELAKELGLSVSTISKALNNNKEISEETREKVKAFAKLYNYKPNRIAQNLRTNSTKTIAVIIPEIVHHYFSQVIQGVINIANDKNYQVMIGLSNESFHQEVMHFEALSNHKIDGIILSLAKETQLTGNHQHLYDLQENNIPLVMFDRVLEEFPCDKVVIDDVNGAKRAVQKLIENGAKKIGLISTEDSLSVGSLRTKGYLRALEEGNLLKDESLILRLEHQFYESENRKELESKIRSLLATHPDLDGILAVNELYASAALRIIRETGKSTPDDIQVIAFTDGVLSKNTFPTLSTVSQHGYLVGEQSARKLFDQIENPTNTTFGTTIIKTEIIERESTK